MNIVDLRRLRWTKTRQSLGIPGSLLKAYESIDKRKIYYKLSSFDSVSKFIGHEAINEVVVSRFLDVLNVEHVKYDLIYGLILLDGKEYKTYLCVSDDYKKEGESKIAIDTYIELNNDSNIDRLSFMKKIGYIDYIYMIFIIDFLIINRDRHGANIELIKSKNSKLRISPLFDHGLSLLFSCSNDEEYKKFNPLGDVKVNNYFGSSSLFENLKLIPKKYLFKINELTNSDLDYIFKDIDLIMSKTWVSSVKNILKRRIKYYENFRNNK